MKKYPCPECGLKNTSYYLRGLTIYNERLKKQLDNNEVILNGCEITVNDPKYYCNDCSKDFGNPKPYNEQQLFSEYKVNS